MFRDFTLWVEAVPLAKGDGTVAKAFVDEVFSLFQLVKEEIQLTIWCFSLES